jgi:hypothetical protein
MNDLNPQGHHLFIIINGPAITSIVRIILEYESINRRPGYAEV